MTDQSDPLPIEQSVTIDAPASDIYSFLIIPETLPEYWPGMALTEPDAAAPLAYTPPTEAVTPPITLAIEPHVIKAAEPTALTMTFEGELEGTVVWRLQDNEGSTNVRAAATYTSVASDDEVANTIPTHDDERLFAGLIDILPAVLETTLATLKTRCEQPSPPAGIVARVEIPDLDYPTSTAISPHLDDVTDHTRQWAHELGMVEIADPPAGLAQLPRLTCRVHPHAPLDALQLCSDWYSWVFLYDDAVDPTERGTDPAEIERFQEPLVAVLEGEERASPEKPLVRAFADIWQRASARMPSAWQDRFAQHHREYFAGNQWEARNRGPSHIPDRPTYINNRRLAAGTAPAFDLVELAQNSGIPPAVYQQAELTALRKAAGNVIAWTNDVYSLRKELAHDEVSNLVVVLRNEQDCSVQAAVAAACEMIDAEARRLDELTQTLSTETDADRTAYREGLEQWITGNLAWSKETMRYGHHE